MLFYKHRFFSNQPQCCLTFKLIETQMLLKSCFLHRGIVLPRHNILCISVSMSTSWSVYICCLIYVICFFIIIFIIINHIISLTLKNLFLEMFVKSSASECCLPLAYVFINFSLAFLIKVLLIKKVFIIMVGQLIMRLILPLKGNGYIKKRTS